MIYWLSFLSIKRSRIIYTKTLYPPRPTKMSLSSDPCVPTSTLEEMAPSPGGGGHQESRDPEVREFRLKINQRERLRMHDLNSALDGLREVSFFSPFFKFIFSDIYSEYTQKYTLVFRPYSLKILLPTGSEEREVLELGVCNTSLLSILDYNSTNMNIVG